MAELARTHQISPSLLNRWLHAAAYPASRRKALSAETALQPSTTTAFVPVELIESPGESPIHLELIRGKTTLRMIRPKQVFLAVEPVDMRWGMERLSCHVQHHLAQPPSEGSAWGFTNRARTRLKLLIWDSTGVWLCQRRLHRGGFGATREAFSGEQKSLFEEDLDQDLAAVEAELAAGERAADPVSSRRTSRRPHPGRTPSPSHLERIEVRHEPEHCTCPTCQSALVKIGEEVTEQLHIEPATFKVIRHIRPQYACRACETVQAAPVAPAIIDGGLPVDFHRNLTRVFHLKLTRQIGA